MKEHCDLDEGQWNFQEDHFQQELNHLTQDNLQLESLSHQELFPLQKWVVCQKLIG